MVQPNKVDFDVRKLRKRKKVSRDRMALHEHVANVASEDAEVPATFVLCACLQ